MKFYKNKKIFIAGGSGLVGTNLLMQLLTITNKISASYYSKIQNINLKKYYKKYNFSNLNDCLKATKNIDIVFIVAVKASGILEMKKNFHDNIAENFLIRSNLLKSCIINNVKNVMWISSSTVYQPHKGKISEKNLNLNKNPYNIYLGTGWLYRYLEKLCFLYNKNKNIDIKIIRTSSIYGPYDNFDESKSHVIPALIKRIKKIKNKIEVWGDPNVTRDFVFVEDLVRAMIILGTKKRMSPVNFSYGNGTSIKKLAETILKIYGHDKKIYFNKSKNNSASYRVLDNKKINKILKNFKRTDLKTGLKKTIEWYQQLRNNE